MLKSLSVDFFQNYFLTFFWETLAGTRCQKIWIQIRTNILSVLIWVQTVRKSYQQMEKVVASKERVKGYRTYVLLVNHYSIALVFVTRHLIG